MNNLNKAIKLEEDYRKLRKKRKEKDAFNYKDKLIALGYNSQEELENDKVQDYIGKKPFNMIETTPDMLLSSISDANGSNTVIFINTNETIVFNAWNGQNIYNSAFCVTHPEFHIIPIESKGETLVASTTDLPVAFVTDNIRMIGYINRKIGDWVESNFQGVEQHEMYRGTINKVGDTYIIYYVIYFDLDPLTSNICHDMICASGLKSLSDHGIKTREDLIINMKTWLH